MTDLALMASNDRPPSPDWRFQPLTLRMLVSPEGIQFVLGVFCIIFEVLSSDPNQFVLVLGMLLCAGAAGKVASWR